MRPVKITETALRDAHQSLMATRLKIDEMIPILEKMDQVGYHALECWGGATFDSCLRFLNEDPWERLRTIRKHVKNTKLQMLLRGQNILGYKNYADDVVEEFVKKSVENGIDIIRIFDALNDTRNIKVALDATKKAGAHAQAAISYTISPIHTTQIYVELAKEMEAMGADSICIKDMSGLLTPFYASELVGAIKAAISVPLEVHSHATSGLASMMYLKAIEAGADIVDTAISPLSSGTSQPPTESLVATLKESDYATGLDLELLSEIADHFRPIREAYMASGILSPKMLSVDINTLIYQVPGGMLSNLVSQLQQQNALDKYEEVLKEVPKVREDLGFPPLVTPTSQMVGTQAVLNVIMGERYKMIPKEIKEYVRGMYGKPTLPISAEIIKKIIGDETPITCRPADTIEPQLEGFRNEMKEYLEQEEDVLSYALFPQVALEFFKLRQTKKYKVDNEFGNKQDQTHYI
ncbi:MULTISPECIES: oxaloacetate decarboxylase subunit alpha [unclassified Fusibacter]|uniref:oxaloacetate decarboxylase subunit alpha n=1 Tax=unclassified Fusibacter TaxID=2624464 RepID=UPI0010103D90|nr:MULTISPECIES: oxaloacetate decarboxylase subunit alpha [unclassified Fusibacter]MCK8060541.1 oxaloacetate decarboxylase subunit alpha [Fusibacter sp. A2]NPE23005.1 oxaloacetate decarboxylase subunit alpha [Fusibacter sp. A1]RXV60070.1 oxaloacetate decarboxylase subunit alpha [Fusibacter sp. A1]